MAECANCGAVKLTERSCPHCGRLPNVPLLDEARAVSETGALRAVLRALEVGSATDGLSATMCRELATALAGVGVGDEWHVAGQELDRATKAEEQLDAARQALTAERFIDAMMESAGGLPPDEPARTMARHALKFADEVGQLREQLDAARLVFAFIAQEAKDGRLEVAQRVPNAPTFWLEAIERRARAALGVEGPAAVREQEA